MADAHTLEFLREVFRNVRGVTFRAMFGGHGIYADGRMFALEADGGIYLKADADNAAAFDERDLPPFVYEGANGKRTVMSYREAPPEALENPDEMTAWARLGQGAALRAAAKKATRRRPAAPRRRKSGSSGKSMSRQ